jgi:hypothetical protein
MRAEKPQKARTKSFGKAQLLRAMDNSKKEQFRKARIKIEADSKANYNLLGSIKQFI